MPQMKPMAWLSIMLMIIMCLKMVFTMIFFSMHPSPNNNALTPSTLKKKSNLSLWHWSW